MYSLLLNSTLSFTGKILLVSSLNIEGTIYLLVEFSPNLSKISSRFVLLSHCRLVSVSIFLLSVPLAILSAMYVIKAKSLFSSLAPFISFT